MIIQGVTLNGTRVVDASIILNNLAIWIDANNSTSYNGSGTTVTDLSGNSRTQNLGAASQYTMLNGVKCFDCNSNSITAAVIGPTLPTSGFTYIAWCRMKSSSTDWRTLYRHSPSDHALLIEVGTDRLGMYDNNTNAFYPAGYNVTSLADVWAQWTVTGDSSGQIFYINGVQVGTTVQTAVGNSHWYLGGIGATQNFGYIANMELYTLILTQEQILQNYYNQLSRFQLPNIVTSNLVLWYDPSFNTSYSGSGSTITNLANTSLAGTLSNITYTDPYFTYNGSSSQVAVADNALLEPGSGDFSIEAWVYYSAIAGSTRTFVSKTNNGGGSADWSYGLRTASNGNTYFEVGNGTTSVTSPAFVASTGTWYQIVGVWTNVASNSIALYVNGVLIGSNSHSFASVKNSTNPLYLGNYNGGEYSQWFNGRMGVTRLYSAALTSAQVLQNYNADKSKYGL